MLITSVAFILFCVFIVFVYYIIPNSQSWILLMGSIIFYASYGVEKLPFILLASMVTYMAAKKMQSIYDEQDNYIEEQRMEKFEAQAFKIKTKKKTKLILTLSITILLILLLYSKANKWIRGGV